MTISQIKSSLYYSMIIFVIIIALFTFLAGKTFLGKTSFYIVRSGSMIPVLSRGDFIVNKKVSYYQSGEIITFHLKDRMITHRIVGTILKNDNLFYTTKGDANSIADKALVSQEAVVGKIVFSFPWVGLGVDFAKTKLGMALLIIIPATLIIRQELLNIKREIEKS